MKIAILGFGVVGSGVYETLRNNAAGVARKAGEPVEVAHILDIRDFSGHEAGALFTSDFEKILNDAEIGVVVECMGGVEPAFSYSKAALEKGKSVATSNKELVAKRGTELLALAERNGAHYFFEASVGGGVPIIRPLSQCLAANRIEEICGILNGTTNYILTEMALKGEDFAAALAEAQSLGYAERNPAADVEGRDTQRKIAILASLASGKFVDAEQIYTEGITGIRPADLALAKRQGYALKLIARAQLQSDGKAFALVAPTFVSKDNPLSNVDDVFNAILVRGDVAGTLMFYGRGAGKLPTASAIVADVIDATKHVGRPRAAAWTENGGGGARPKDEWVWSYIVTCGKSGAALAKRFEKARILEENEESATFAAYDIKEKDFLAAISESGAAGARYFRILE
jgi:homoserine dehydrogenase